MSPTMNRALKPILAFAAAALVTATLVPTLASAQGPVLGSDPTLFHPSSARLSEASDDAAVLRRSPLAIDLGVIEALAIEEDGKLAPSPVSLGIELFDGLQASFVLDQVTFETEDTMSLIGHLAEVKDSQAIFVVGGGLLAGSIHTPTSSYRIQTTSTGQQVLEEVDINLYPEELEPEPVDPPTESETAADGAQGTVTRSDNGSQFDLLVAYTATARAAAGSTAAIQNLITLGVTETNQAFANSGVIPRLRLVHTVEVAYTESGNLQTDRDRLRATNDGHIDNVHTLRNTHKADLVKLVVSTSAGGACGIAYLMNGSNNTAFQSSAFAVTARNCISPNYTFGHELGHIFGCNHAPGDPTGTGAFSYSFGYKDTANVFRTIMGYNCGGSGCPRVLRWSNPNLTLNGRVTGTATQNNATSINNVRTVIANFRDSGATTPTVPAVPTLNWQTDFCRGFGQATWTASAGATSYELRASVNSSFTSPYIVYSGSATSVFVNNPGARYLRVRACNANGCSAYSNQQFARFYSICL